MIKEIEYPTYANSVGLQRITWGAVFAGTIVSLAVLVALTSLGAGIGLVSVPSAVSQGAAIGFGIGSGVWMLVAGVVSFYAGGWIAGRLTGIARVSESVIHGLVSWGLATVMLAFVFTTATVGALSTGVSAVIGRPGLDLNLGTVTEPNPIGAPDVATGARAAGAAGLFGFLMIACNAAASAAGARAGTRVLRPVPAEVRRPERTL